MLVELQPAPADAGADRDRSPLASRLLPSLVLVALLVVTPSSLSAVAAPQQSTTPADAAPADASAETAAGWRIYRDPETGRLLSEPLPGQAESLSAKWERRRAGSPPSTNPRVFPIVLRGRPVGTGVALEGRFVTSTVVRTLPDGSLSVECRDAQQGPDDHDHPSGPPIAPPTSPPER